MRLTLDDDWTTTVTADPLHITPCLDFRDFRVRIAMYANVEERGRFLRDTFGSQPDCGHPRRAQVRPAQS